MSSANIENVRRVFEAFGRDGVDGMFNSNLVAPDFVWDASAMGVPGIGVYRGPDELRAGFEAWFGAFPFSEWTMEIDEIVEADEKVVVFTRQRGRGAESAAVVELTLGQVVTMRNGLAVRMDVYLARDQALAAAGLND